jgi:hypothetical protein
MYFDCLLDALFGTREVLHRLECSICGFDEIYYIDTSTRQQIGRACQGCNYVQKFDVLKS